MTSNYHQTNSGDSELDKKIEQWLKWDKNEKTLNEIESMIKLKNWTLLEQRLSNRMTFGTAGLRGPMRAGFDSMNDLVIIQTGQGLVAYIKEQFPSDEDRKRGVVISYDGRHNSKRFAELTACIFINEGYTVNLFGKMTATPFVPFCVSRVGALAGIMVTASHNPKEDNGYKVYWENSAQIISPHDKQIQNFILKNLTPLESSWNVEMLSKSDLLKDPYNEIFDQYYEALLAQIPPRYIEINLKTPMKIVYSAMHGVGYPFVEEAFKRTRLQPVDAVVEQRDPDPDFPTVKFPNPEEGKSSLVMSIALAESTGSDLIFANDPDADRLAIAERCFNSETNSSFWKVFNGNEIGTLLGWWSLQYYKEKNPNNDLKNCYILASTVSSKMLKTMSVAEGFNFEETLTGFKWMGNRSVELIKMGKTVLFAFEEAIGFMMSPTVLDKDGVSAAAHLGALASYLKAVENMTLTDKLDQLYSQYGYHFSLNSYYLCYDTNKITKIFERIRNWNGKSGAYPSQFVDGKFEICNVRDLTTGLDTSMPDGKSNLPTSKSSQMITFNIAVKMGSKSENKIVLTLRTSGTEPKIKYYSEYCATPEEKNKVLVQETLKEIVTIITEELLQPKQNELISKSD